MSSSNFRSHKITRTCNKVYSDYHSYQKYLLTDFSHRCCYCNIHQDTLGTTSFQIDHFIPKKQFEGKRDELLTQYTNLMLACPKCNRAKSDQYEGDLTSPAIENKLFYNPDLVDYNTIFYRNELGGISSNDDKGKDMIKRLKLYRPVHNYAWVLEMLSNLISQIDTQICSASGDDKEKLESIRNKLAYKHYIMRSHFLTAYRQK